MCAIEDLKGFYLFQKIQRTSMHIEDHKGLVCYGLQLAIEGLNGPLLAIKYLIGRLLAI